MWPTNDPEEKFYAALGLDEKTAEKFSRPAGGLWYGFLSIFYGCLPFVFIALFVFDVIDLKFLLLLSLIWFVGNLICNYLHHILNYVQMSSLLIPKMMEISKTNIDKMVENIHRNDNQ